MKETKKERKERVPVWERPRAAAREPDWEREMGRPRAFDWSFGMASWTGVVRAQRMAVYWAELTEPDSASQSVRAREQKRGAELERQRAVETGLQLERATERPMLGNSESRKELAKGLRREW